MKPNSYYQSICRFYRFGIVTIGVMLGIYNLFFSTSYYVLLSFAFCLFPLIPFAVDNVFRMKPTYLVHLSIYLFSTLAYGVGMLFNGYHLIPYFDKLTHLLSGVAFAMLGSCLFYGLKHEKELAATDGVLNCSFSFSFSMAIAAIWELMEYGIDFVLHNDPQNVLTTGVHDTMLDLLTCMIGTILVIAFLARFYHHGKASFFSRLIQSYHEVNRSET